MGNRKAQIELVKNLLENSSSLVNQTTLFMKSRTTHTLANKLLKILIKKRFMSSFQDKNMIIYLRTKKGERLLIDLNEIVEGMDGK